MNGDAKDQEAPGALTREAGLLAAGVAATLLTALELVLLFGLVQLWPAEPGIQPLLSNNARFLGWKGALTGQERLVLLMGMAGALGSGVYSLRSLAWYAGNRNLYLKWLPFYFVTPVVGAVLGILLYIVIRAAILPTLAPGQTLNPFGFVALAALLGLFSSQVVAFLNSVAGQVFSKAARPMDESALSKAVGQVVSRSIESVLSGPVLDNYAGFVSLRLEDNRQVQLPASDGIFEATPGTACSLVATLQSARPSDLAAQEIDIRDGNDLPEVSFRLTVESETLDFDPSYKDILAPATGDPTSAVFSFSIPPKQQQHELWLNILQKDRLVQVVPARIAVRGPRSS